ncbi:MAG TPA: hypothetical protein VKF62_12220 [Planctomycetota bacterium]|nr:hypothetical protein [Planctomycetota bacterium]
MNRLLPTLLLALPACASLPEGPVVVVQTSGGEEIGASTNHGVVFAGRTASKGVARVLVFFGDGPSVETGEIEEAGPGLFTVSLEIRVPTAEISVESLSPGETVRLAGRRDGVPWTSTGRVAAAGGAGGIETSGGIPREGALAFRREEGHWRLSGIVFPADSGPATILGPEALWRVLLRPQPLGPAPNVPKRPDVR